jgi:bloom syndrome protein
MIDQNKDLEYSERQRQKHAVEDMVRYCQNTAVCRRVQVLRYFGEEFKAEHCHKYCDVCLDPGEVYTEDLTALATEAVKLVRAIAQRENLTKAHLIAVFRGRNLVQIRDKGHDKEPGYGAGKDLTDDKADRLFGMLLERDALEMKVVHNRAGHAHTYMKVRADRALPPPAAELTRRRRSGRARTRSSAASTRLCSRSRRSRPRPRPAARGRRRRSK